MRRSNLNERIGQSKAIQNLVRPYNISSSPDGSVPYFEILTAYFVTVISPKVVAAKMSHLSRRVLGITIQPYDNPLHLFDPLPYLTGLKHKRSCSCAGQVTLDRPPPPQILVKLATGDSPNLPVGQCRRSGYRHRYVLKPRPTLV
jgi:hypothetical protein